MHFKCHLSFRSLSLSLVNLLVCNKQRQLKQVIAVDFIGNAE